MPGLLVRATRVAADRPERKLGVEIFAPGVITTGAYELTTTFAKDGNTALWTVSTPAYGRWLSILESRRRNGRWSTPTVASFAGRWIDADPMFTEDGSRLFFLSRRPMSGDTPERGYRIWYVDRVANGWGTPMALPAAVNNSDMHYVMPVRSGAIYVASVRPDSRNQADVYRIPFVNGAWTEPENVGATVNSADHWDTTPYVSPDESWMIFASRGRPGQIGELDLFISFRENGAWTTPLLLPAPINGVAREYCPIVSPDGRWLYFTSERGFFDSQRSSAVPHAELRRALSEPGNGLGDVYRTSLSELLAWARENRR
jgi:hypothetical protein